MSSQIPGTRWQSAPEAYVEASQAILKGLVEEYGPEGTLFILGLILRDWACGYLPPGVDDRAWAARQSEAAALELRGRIAARGTHDPGFIFRLGEWCVNFAAALRRR